ncbi:hypothetical protein D3C84_861740 [compost metagenome]
MNEGHECILAEAFHGNDPLPATIDFNVPTDRHVAQKNLSVLLAMKSMFHMNFEMHNGSRKKREFTTKIQQVMVDRIIKEFPEIQKMIKGKEEGKLISAEFTNSRCPDSDEKSKETNGRNREDRWRLCFYYCFTVFGKNGNRRIRIFNY